MNAITCPKCGFTSQSDQTCDHCGALISRILERERTLAAQRDFDDFGSPASALSYDTRSGSSSTSGRLTKAVLILGVLAIAAFFGRGMFQPKTAHSTYVHDFDSTSFKTLVLDGPADKTWVIDFWASWCGPCRQFAPEFDATAESVSPKAGFGKVNVDISSDLAQKYNISGIPAVLIIRDGRVVDQGHGMDRERLKAWVESVL